MYPYVRAAWMMWKGRSMPAMGLYDTHVSHHRAWPWDTDLFMELNNGRIPTLMELGRWQAGMRMGITQKVMRERIMFPVAGYSIRFRHRIPMMQRFRLQTRFLGFDERFTYVEQSMWQGDRCMNQMVLRFAIKSKAGSMTPAEMLSRFGFDGASPGLPDWVVAWIDADARRVWPPEGGPVYEN